MSSQLNINVRERRRSQQLQLKLAETEVALLRAQLEPHFLFNALNSISSLVRLGHADRAMEAISQLATLLRGMLEVGQRSIMPWQWEQQFTSMYVQLQTLRFGDRLEVDIAAKLPRGTGVPACLLQPLIENSIRHGPLKNAQPCRIHVSLRAGHGRVVLTVQNPVADGLSTPGAGLGLTNVEARLRAIYNDDFSFCAERRGDSYVVEVSFPEMSA